MSGNWFYRSYHSRVGMRTTKLQRQVKTKYETHYKQILELERLNTHIQ